MLKYRYHLLKGISMINTRKITSPILLTLAALIWGLAFSAQKAADTVPAFSLGMARSIVGAIFLIPVIMIFDRIGKGGRVFISKKGIDLNKTELIGGAVLGVILASASFLQQFGINSGTDAGKASFITALYVVLVPVYGCFVGRKAPLNVWISIVIAVVGFYLLCITEELGIVGSDIYVILCALIFPVHILVIDRYSPRCDGIRMSMVQFFTAFLVNLLFAVIFEGGLNIHLVFANILPILFLGIGSSGIAYTLQIIGQKGANPAAASLLLSMESVFGVLGSAVLLHERMSPREYIGCAVVLIAVILSQIDPFSLIGKKKEIGMTHSMQLNDTPFTLMEKGIKKIELRLYDEKRQHISVGDTIVFTHRDDPCRKLTKRVEALHVFDSFEALYKSLPLIDCGYTEDELPTASASDMEEYYSLSEQKKYGVVGIELR